MRIPKTRTDLQGTLEFAWQGIGEYADQYEVNEVGISLRESQLTELPLDEEACSTCAHLLLALGVLNWRKGDYEKADEQLSEVLKIAAKLQDNWFQAQCFNAIALVKTSMERIGDAIDAYKQAIRLAPKQIFAWNNLGNLCSKIGRDDEAIIAFLKALECNSKDPIAWNGLGNVYYKKSYTDDAIAAFRKSIHFMPTFSHPWNGLGDVYADSGRLNEAIQAYKQAIELNKVYITPWLNLGALFTKQGKYREAINAYDAALKFDSRNVAIWNDLGNVHLKCESYDEAISAFTKAAEIDHTNGRAYSNLALTYFQKGRYEQAVPLYLKSLEILKEDKDKANSWNCLADIYRLLNKYDLAIDAYRKADMLEWGIMQEERTDDGSKRPAIAAPTPGINLKVAAEINESVKDLDILQDTVKPAIGLQKEIDAEMVAHNIAGAPAWILNPKSEELCIDISQVQLINPVTQETKGDVVIKQKLFDLHHNKDNITMNQTAHVELVEHHAANNTNAIAWNEKGNFYFKRGALNDAINAYNKAIQFDPSFGWPYSNLALTYLAQGQNAELILLYQKSLDLLNSDKDKAVSWNGLGNAYLKTASMLSRKLRFQLHDLAVQLDQVLVLHVFAAGRLLQIRSYERAFLIEVLKLRFQHHLVLGVAIDALVDALCLQLQGVGRLHVHLEFFRKTAGILGLELGHLPIDLIESFFGGLQFIVEELRRGVGLLPELVVGFLGELGYQLPHYRLRLIPVDI